ncbi:MAG: sigma-70 family RNA polymerase sigma factor [Candidatus Hydrogenedentes bacterium]|nr:sigma-70 family RNA polymerase sigma factor [Candidatus Hydrogenedentota bacterium]
MSPVETYSQYKNETPPQPSDEELVARCRDGHRDAFNTLVTRYQPRLFSFIVRMVANRADAEDLFQETFLRVYRHLDRFRAGAPFRPWLYRIATNACRDHLRRARRRRTVSLDRESFADGPAPIDRAASTLPGPGERAREAELAERLAAAVAKLPVKQRAVFLMARYDGMPYGEIGRALGIPVGTVKSRMNKAVSALMRELEEAQA